MVKVVFLIIVLIIIIIIMIIKITLIISNLFVLSISCPQSLIYYRRHYP